MSSKTKIKNFKFLHDVEGRELFLPMLGFEKYL